MNKLLSPQIKILGYLYLWALCLSSFTSLGEAQENFNPKSRHNCLELADYMATIEQKDRNILAQLVFNDYVAKFSNIVKKIKFTINVHDSNSELELYSTDHARLYNFIKLISFAIDHDLNTLEISDIEAQFLKNNSLAIQNMSVCQKYDELSFDLWHKIMKLKFANSKIIINANPNAITPAASSYKDLKNIAALPHKSITTISSTAISTENKHSSLALPMTNKPGNFSTKEKLKILQNTAIIALKNFWVPLNIFKKDYKILFIFNSCQFSNELIDPPMNNAFSTHANQSAPMSFEELAILHLKEILELLPDHASVSTAVINNFNYNFNHQLLAPKKLLDQIQSVKNFNDLLSYNQNEKYYSMGTTFSEGPAGLIKKIKEKMLTYDFIFFYTDGYSMQNIAIEKEAEKKIVTTLDNTTMIYKPLCPKYNTFSEYMKFIKRDHDIEMDNSFELPSYKYYFELENEIHKLLH